MKKRILFSLLFLLSANLFTMVETGLDRVFNEPYVNELKGKKIGLVTNQSAIDSNQVEAFDLFFQLQDSFDYTLSAAFAPEHGLKAKRHAFEKIDHEQRNGIQIYSLHGDHKRPTEEMLSNVDFLIYDMQSVGVRCYTYETTLCYLMEEAAKHRIPLMVLDRPNPRGGQVVEGGELEDRFKSFFSYNKVPLCHGMTIGELARYLNQEEKIGCDLRIVSMQGWKRSMPYEETGLPWSAPSPNIPDPQTALVYPATIFLGESLEIVSVDLRGEKPFKRLGAPWLEGPEFADVLNQRNLPGVVFVAEKFTPKWGKFESTACGGVYLKITAPNRFQPLLTQYVIIEELMNAYPIQFEHELKAALSKGRRKTCNYITGNEYLMTLIESRKNFSQELKLLENQNIKDFLNKREKYLIY